MADTPIQQRGRSDGPREPPLRTTSPTGQGVREQEHRRDARNVSYWYPDRKGDITEVTAGYSTLFPVNPAVLLLLPIAAIALILFRNNVVVYALWSVVMEMSKEHSESLVSLVMFLACSVIIVYLVSLFFAKRQRRIYLVPSFCCLLCNIARWTTQHFSHLKTCTLIMSTSLSCQNVLGTQHILI